MSKPPLPRIPDYLFAKDQKAAIKRAKRQPEAASEAMCKPYTPAEAISRSLDFPNLGARDRELAKEREDFFASRARAAAMPNATLDEPTAREAKATALHAESVRRAEESRPWTFTEQEDIVAARRASFRERMARGEIGERPKPYEVCQDAGQRRMGGDSLSVIRRISEGKYTPTR